MTIQNEDIKKELLVMAEKVSRDAVDSAFKIIEIAVKASENKFDDMIIAALPLLKETALKYIDKISEEV